MYQRNRPRRRIFKVHQKSVQSAPKNTLSFSENLRNYLKNTSLHGLKYVGDSYITNLERIFFFCSFIIAFMISGYFISNVWDKWSATPVIISLNPVLTDSKTIPFPAVTICNMNQAKRKVADEINV